MEGGGQPRRSSRGQGGANQQGGQGAREPQMDGPPRPEVLEPGKVQDGTPEWQGQPRSQGETGGPHKTGGRGRGTEGHAHPSPGERHHSPPRHRTPTHQRQSRQTQMKRNDCRQTLPPRHHHPHRRWNQKPHGAAPRSPSAGQPATQPPQAQRRTMPHKRGAEGSSGQYPTQKPAAPTGSTRKQTPPDPPASPGPNTRTPDHPHTARPPSPAAPEGPATLKDTISLLHQFSHIQEKNKKKKTHSISL
ncbi:proline-rich protein 2-like [Thalassophryne amazonica]|uniref:proline-rich protein 2-like n=1 Tax=Thalassophryne amazonica TaxID=390379 RepID=UPI001470E271|nr:proline-rich protein 2-like [Thalassophryne amazonica]